MPNPIPDLDSRSCTVRWRERAEPYIPPARNGEVLTMVGFRLPVSMKRELEEDREGIQLVDVQDRDRVAQARTAGDPAEEAG